MAGRMIRTTSGPVLVSASTTRTLLTLTAPSTHGVVVNLIQVTGEGVDSTKKPQLVEVFKFIDDNGAGSTSATVSNLDTQDDGSPATTAKKAYTAGLTPTPVTIVWSPYVRTTAGDIFPGRLRLKAGESVGCRVTGPADLTSVNWTIEISGEE